MISNITGKLADDSIATAKYWVNHIRQPVRFAQSMETLHQQEEKILRRLHKDTAAKRKQSKKVAFDVQETVVQPTSPQNAATSSSHLFLLGKQKRVAIEDDPSAWD